MEDPTQSRQVEWPGATIFLWPMRDGVCDSVASKSGGGSGSGCVPLDHLARQGVSVGLRSSPRHQSVYGVVVDGIQEVVITSSAGPDLRVNVKENFFFVDLNSATGEPRPSGWETAVQSVRWRYADKQRSFNLAQVLRHDRVPPAPSPEVSAGEPTPRFDPIAESASDPLEFTFAGTRYTALGFQTQRSGVCTTLRDADNGRTVGTSCLAERGLRDELESRPAHLFASGGAGGGWSTLASLARRSPNWLRAPAPSSCPSRGAPNRGKATRSASSTSSNPNAGPPESGRPLGVSLTARLSDGRTVQIP